MKRLLIYVDASVIGGCEDAEFAEDSRALWRCFIEGRHGLVLSSLTVAELKGAPDAVRERILQVPAAHRIMIAESPAAQELADAYLQRGVVGPGSRADSMHVALATIGRVDVLVSWNFKHIVNLGRIRRFNAVNVEYGYAILDVRTPKEVLEYE